ncbi:YihA family ribosome biogenesis GTP-binding protein [bacterium]|nr:YihA family ribosome biogenesis GTP-binding protein [candidate division CSSED10-310 bacterium]
MKVLSAELAACAVSPDQYPRPMLPKIAFIGRSNVGKSSLINRLLNRKKLARTSSCPGKTQTVNFYRVNGVFDLVDLPGYGYAKVPVSIYKDMQHRIGSFLDHMDGLCGLVHLVDIRHDPTALDRTIGVWLGSGTVPMTWVLVKADKVTRGVRPAAAQRLRRILELPQQAPVLYFSSVDGTGKVELWSRISALLAAGTTSFQGMPTGVDGGEED